MIRLTSLSFQRNKFIFFDLLFRIYYKYIYIFSSISRFIIFAVDFGAYTYINMLNYKNVAYTDILIAFLFVHLLRFTMAYFASLIFE